MKYIAEKEFRLQNTAVTIGKFDGIHTGHQCLLNRILEEKAEGLLSVMLTFRIIPGIFTASGESGFIHTEEERVEYLNHSGLDYLISYPFDESTAALKPDEFIERILAGQLGAKFIAVGSDFRFGKNRKGDVNLLRARASELGYRLCVMDKLADGQEAVSSSRVRRALSAGDMGQAALLLGRPFVISGEVVYGNQIGRELGMPTANLRPSADKLLPPNGVYASKVKVGESIYQGVTNIGYKPTVGGETMPGVETYLLGFSGNLYGQKIEVELYRFLRGERKFASMLELKNQMRADMEEAWR